MLHIYFWHTSQASEACITWFDMYSSRYLGLWSVKSENIINLLYWSHFLAGHWLCGQHKRNIHILVSEQPMVTKTMANPTGWPLLLPSSTLTLWHQVGALKSLRFIFTSLLSPSTLFWLSILFGNIECVLYPLAHNYFMAYFLPRFHGWAGVVLACQVWG